jgi:hypothetical protein
MHPIKRKIAIVLLGLGTVAGFAHGFHTMRGRACARRDAFERHVAEVCVDAARRDGSVARTGDEGPRPNDAPRSDTLR